MRILILDDHALIASMLADWLQELGHEVVGPVATAAEALTALAAGPVEAALIDLHLRDGDSYAVASRLRADGIPFAFASGDGPGGLAEDFRDCSALSKPFEFESVEALIAEWDGSAAGTPRETARPDRTALP